MGREGGFLQLFIAPAERRMNVAGISRAPALGLAVQLRSRHCTGIIAKRSQRFAWLSNTILSRWPAKGHIQFALAGALFRLGLGADSTTTLSVATGLIAGFVFLICILLVKVQSARSNAEEKPYENCIVACGILLAPYRFPGKGET
jgi:hypothetical protein